jgi:tetratricopeptide (TPR) repeat protein
MPVSRYLFILLILGQWAVTVAQNPSAPAKPASTPTETAPNGVDTRSKEEKIAAMKAANKDKPAVNVMSASEEALRTYQRGVEFENARKYDSAVVVYSQAIQTDPNLVDAMLKRAGVRFLQVEFNLSLRDYDYAVEQAKKQMENFSYKASIKKVLGDFEGQKVDQAKSEYLKEKLAEAYFGRGHLKQFMEDKSGGCDDLQLARDMGHQRAKSDLLDLCK